MFRALRQTSFSADRLITCSVGRKSLFFQCECLTYTLHATGVVVTMRRIYTSVVALPRRQRHFHYTWMLHQHITICHSIITSRFISQHDDFRGYTDGRWEFDIQRQSGGKRMNRGTRGGSRHQVAI